MATIAAATDVQSPTMEPLLLCHDDGRVRTLTLNRPAKYNALSGALIGDLLTAFEAAANDRSVHVIVLGAVGKAYSAGHDLSEVAQADKAENPSDCEARL